MELSGLTSISLFQRSVPLQIVPGVLFILLVAINANSCDGGQNSSCMMP